VGRQTPQHSQSNSINHPAPNENEDQLDSQNASRGAKSVRPNLFSLSSQLVSINISLPNSERIVKDITLNSYIGRVPYQKPLRGDRPVKISSIEGAGNREIYPSKERSWLPYFLKNASQVSQLREGTHSRGGSIVSSGTPNHARPEKPSAHVRTFTPQSQTGAEGADDDDKPTKIKVNLPPVTTTSSASPAVSDSSSLHVHHPRPTKHINIADIDDSSSRLRAFLDPQTVSPSHSHSRTASAALPETAVHAQPFQPSNFLPTQQPSQQQIPAPYGANVPFFYPPPFAAMPTDYPANPQQNPYLIPAQPRYESNGMVYYYDPAYYYFQQQPIVQTGTPVQPVSQPASQPSEQPDSSSTNQQPPVYYYQMGVPDPQRMGMYFPYQQGT
jgi:hypothetical protein